RHEATENGHEEEKEKDERARKSRGVPPQPAKAHEHTECTGAVRDFHWNTPDRPGVFRLWTSFKFLFREVRVGEPGPGPVRRKHHALQVGAEPRNRFFKI